MSRLTLLAAIAVAALAGKATALPRVLPAGSANAPVESLDLERYLGPWHEVARRPQFFQRHCVSDTTATYTRTSAERIRVINRCRDEDGEVIEAAGEARTTPRAGALEVSFLPRALAWLPVGWGDYWVVDLDPDYRWAVVGGPSRKALWVLARDPALPPALFDRIRQRAEARGYGIEDWILSPAQTAAMPQETSAAP